MDYVCYRNARRTARNAVRECKNKWFVSLAEKIEKSRFNSAQVWSCIKTIQQARSGLPSRASVAVMDEDGNLCTSAMDQGQRWCRHLDKVLNIQSMYNADVLDGVSQQPVLEELADIPTYTEIQNAIRELANGKAAGESGILPEMVKAGGPPLVNALVSLLRSVWKEECVPRDWVNCNLVPIPKKGDLRLCDN